MADASFFCLFPYRWKQNRIQLSAAALLYT